MVDQCIKSRDNVLLQDAAALKIAAMSSFDVFDAFRQAFLKRDHSVHSHGCDVVETDTKQHGETVEGSGTMS